MDASHAKRNQQIGLDILDKMLKGLDYLPKRNFTKVNEFKAHLAARQGLIINATEQSIQRLPPEKQQQFYFSKNNPQ